MGEEEEQEERGGSKVAWECWASVPGGSIRKGGVRNGASGGRGCSPLWVGDGCPSVVTRLVMHLDKPAAKRITRGREGGWVGESVVGRQEQRGSSRLKARHTQTHTDTHTYTHVHTHVQSQAMISR